MKNLIDIFEEHKGLPINKFPHHLRIYDQLFAAHRLCKPGLSVLEIGLGNGGSLELWRKYFGEKATIFGVDIQDLTYLKVDANVLVGDQGKREFWGVVKGQLGNLDIIIDDGSHRCQDQLLTLHELFPILNDGGLYVIEDIHTSYREDYGGGLYNPTSFVEYLKRVIDVLHAPEFGGEPGSHIFALHVYPNLAIIEKQNPGTWGGSTVRPVEPC